MAPPAVALRLARQSHQGGVARLLDLVERRVGLTVSGVSLVGVAVGGWMLARVLSSRALFVIVYGLVLLLVISWLTGRRRLALAATRSELPPRARVGQGIDVDLTFVSKRRMTTVIFEEEMHPHLGANVSMPVSVLPAGKEIAHRYSINPRLRGVYNVGPLMATWSDPFGLTRQRVLISEPVEVIVHPVVERVHDRVISREWEDPPIRPPVSKAWPTGFEFYGMRDYTPGDDPRRIVWRATARTLDTETGAGRYLVREAEQGITDRVVLVLDTDRENHAPGHPSETFELAVRTVASLGVRHLEDGFSVNVDVNGKRIVAGMRGRRDRIPLLDELARVKTERVPLRDALDRLIVDARRNTHNVVVTSYVDVESARRIRILRDRGLEVMVVLVTWEQSSAASAHRVAALGCNVVEVEANAPLEIMFRKVLSAGGRP